jgi:hypothetical protein
MFAKYKPLSYPIVFKAIIVYKNNQIFFRKQERRPPTVNSCFSCKNSQEARHEIIHNATKSNAARGNLIRWTYNEPTKNAFSLQLRG